MREFLMNIYEQISSEEIKIDEFVLKKYIMRKIQEILPKRGRKAEKLREIASEISGEDMQKAKIKYHRIHQFPYFYRAVQVYNENTCVIMRDDGLYKVFRNCEPPLHKNQVKFTLSLLTDKILLPVLAQAE